MHADHGVPQKRVPISMLWCQVVRPYKVSRFSLFCKSPSDFSYLLPQHTSSVMTVRDQLHEISHYRNAYLLALSAAMGSIFYGWDM